MNAPTAPERERHVLLQARGAFARCGRVVHDAWVRSGWLGAWGTTVGVIALSFVWSGALVLVFCVLLLAWDRADRLERAT